MATCLVLILCHKYRFNRNSQIAPPTLFPLEAEPLPPCVCYVCVYVLVLCSREDVQLRIIHFREKWWHRALDQCRAWVTTQQQHRSISYLLKRFYKVAGMIHPWTLDWLLIQLGLEARERRVKTFLCENWWVKHRGRKGTETRMKRDNVCTCILSVWSRFSRCQCCLLGQEGGGESGSPSGTIYNPNDHRCFLYPPSIYFFV